MEQNPEQVEAESGVSRNQHRDGHHVTTTDSTDTTVAQVKQKRFPVIELFGPVIQGEGAQAGLQTMFIRFGGCDYRCEKCDSLHAVIPEAVQKHATYMTAEEIYLKVAAANHTTGVKWVTFSGGNPCMHKLDELVTRLNEGGYHINVETQGTLWQDWLNGVSLITIAPKMHGMGEKFEEDKFTYFLQQAGARPICIKVVAFANIDLEMALRVEDLVNQAYADYARITDSRDYDQLPWVAYYLSLGNPFPPVLNPHTFELEDNPILADESETAILADKVPLTLPERLLKSYKNLSEEVLADKRLKNWRFLPQLHVLVYGNETER